MKGKATIPKRQFLEGISATKTFRQNATAKSRVPITYLTMSFLAFLPDVPSNRINNLRALSGVA